MTARTGMDRLAEMVKVVAAASCHCTLPIHATLINAKWRMITETRKKQIIALDMHRTWCFCLNSLFKSTELWVASRMNELASKPSETEKLTRIMLDWVRSRRNLWNTLAAKAGEGHQNHMKVYQTDYLRHRRAATFRRTIHLRFA